MKVGIFSVYDKKTAAFMQPFFQHTRGQAMRTLTDTVKGRESLIGSHPEDFQLFQVGEFDDQEGKIVPLKDGRFVCNASELVSGLPTFSEVMKEEQ